MLAPRNTLQDARALVIDGNPQSRAILVTQLKELGLNEVVQCSRLIDGRNRLEASAFDLVLCEQYFEREEHTGQDLLDDLRRNQLLPFSTVFIMVTADVTYAKVAEAAESALDAYLIKPHSANGLADRITQARRRKLELRDIFRAIDAEDYETAVALCLERFQSQATFWLYAARIGAEMLLRLGRLAEAQELYESVVTAKPLPWAKLGVARVQLEAGHPNRAATTLAALIESDPEYSDAYDMLGRALFEQGQFEAALFTFRMSTQITPSSVNRLLKHGMMAYYAGEREEGIELLDRATLIGLDSKLYDAQALVLLGFAHLDNNDRRGLQRCADQLERLKERQEGNARLERLQDVLHSLIAIHERQLARALDNMRRMAKTILDPAFDFEAGSNLLSLMTRLAIRSIQLYEVDAAVDNIGRRFCTSRALTDLLACAAVGRTDFSNRIKATHAEVVKLAEQAMALSLEGDPRAAVITLLENGGLTCNAKLIESAHLVLARYRDRIPDHDALLDQAQALRERYRTVSTHAGLGEQASTGRAAGGVSLPSAYRPSRNEGLLAKFSAV